MNRHGAHVYWTRPRGGETATFKGFEKLTIAASCLMWQSLNGPITLYTDDCGVEQLCAVGMLPYWNEVDVSLLRNIPKEIDAKAFWDLGKAVVLQELSPGSSVLDLDLVVWEPVALPNESVGFLHWEQPVAPWYPGLDGLSRPENYRFADDIDWSRYACNTAFTCSPSQSFARLFAAEAMSFAFGNKPAGCGLGEFLFAGQRLYSHVGQKLGLDMHPLLDFVYDPTVDSIGKTHPLHLYACEQGTCFTHLWRNKWHLHANENAAREYNCWLIERCLALVPTLHFRRQELESIGEE